MISETKWFRYIIDHICCNSSETTVCVMWNREIIKVHRLAANYIAEWKFFTIAVGVSIVSENKILAMFVTLDG